jgi:hypothetical protein
LSCSLLRLVLSLVGSFGDRVSLTGFREPSFFYFKRELRTKDVLSNVLSQVEGNLSRSRCNSGISSRNDRFRWTLGKEPFFGIVRNLTRGLGEVLV